jgi:Xaa-Pro dipeptidase
MEVLNATGLAERLRWEDNEYWLHLEAESPFEKYPGKLEIRRVRCVAILTLRS